jgi:hypothetical protein
MKPAKIIMASAKHPCIFGSRPGANDNDRVKSWGAASLNTMANLGDQEKKVDRWWRGLLLRSSRSSTSTSSSAWHA